MKGKYVIPDWLFPFETIEANRNPSPYKEVMSATPAILTDFPHSRYLPDERLITWHLQGVLDDKLAEHIVDFLQMEELIVEEPFNRYMDLSGITEVHFKAAHVFWIADRRRTYSGLPVKSAFVADWTPAFGIARLYEELMHGAAIEVRVFRSRDAAGEWLGVPVNVLLPE